MLWRRPPSLRRLLVSRRRCAPLHRPKLHQGLAGRGLYPRVYSSSRVLPWGRRLAGRLRSRRRRPPVGPHRRRHMCCAAGRCPTAAGPSPPVSSSLRCAGSCSKAYGGLLSTWAGFRQLQKSGWRRQTLRRLTFHVDSRSCTCLWSCCSCGPLSALVDCEHAAQRSSTYCEVMPR